MGSSQTRARTRVSCVGRQILNHCATREAPYLVFKDFFFFASIDLEVVYRIPCVTDNPIHFIPTWFLKIFFFCLDWLRSCLPYSLCYWQPYSFHMYLVLKDFFFWCGPFKKSVLNLLQYCLCCMLWFLGLKARGILAPWPGLEPTAPALEGGVLTTGPPGRPLPTYFKQHVV